MAQTAVTAPAFTVLDLPGGERNLIGLARVSTDAQDAQLQHDALTGAGCGRIYEEKASTRKAAAERPGLAAALGLPAPRRHARRLEARPPRPLRQGSAHHRRRPPRPRHRRPDPHRQAVRQLLADRRGQVLLHHDGRVRRARAGHHPRAHHGRAGRRQGSGPQRRAAHRDGPDKLAAARARRARGESPTQIARALGVSRASVYRHLGATASRTRPARQNRAQTESGGKSGEAGRLDSENCRGCVLVRTRTGPRRAGPLSAG